MDLETALTEDLAANVPLIAGRFSPTRPSLGGAVPATVYRVIHSKPFEAHTGEGGQPESETRTHKTIVQLEHWAEKYGDAKAVGQQTRRALRNRFPGLLGTENPVHVQKVCTEPGRMARHDGLKLDVLLQDVEIWWEESE